MSEDASLKAIAREILACRFDDSSYAGTAIDIRTGRFVGIPAEQAIAAMLAFGEVMRLTSPHLPEQPLPR